LLQVAVKYDGIVLHDGTIPSRIGGYIVRDGGCLPPDLNAFSTMEKDSYPFGYEGGFPGILTFESYTIRMTLFKRNSSQVPGIFKSILVLTH
jgi:hypothetical protein